MISFMKFTMVTITVSPADLMNQLNGVYDIPLVGDALLYQFVKELSTRPFTLVSGVECALYLQKFVDFVKDAPWKPPDSGLSGYPRKFLEKILNRMIQNPIKSKTVQNLETQKDLFSLLLFSSSVKLYLRIAKIMLDVPDKVTPTNYAWLKFLGAWLINPKLILVRPAQGYDAEITQDCELWRAEVRAVSVMLRQVHANLLNRLGVSADELGIYKKLPDIRIFRSQEIFEGLDVQLSVLTAETQGGIGDRVSSWFVNSNITELAAKLNRPPAEIGADLNEIISSVPMFSLGNAVASGIMKFGDMVAEFWRKCVEALPLIIPAFVSFLAATCTYFKVTAVRVAMCASVSLGYALNLGNMLSLIPSKIYSLVMGGSPPDEDGDLPLFEPEDEVPSGKETLFDAGSRFSDSDSEADLSSWDRYEDMVKESKLGVDPIYTADTQNSKLSGLAILGKRLVAFYIAGGMRVRPDVSTVFKNLHSANLTADLLVKDLVSVFLAVFDGVLPGYVTEVLADTYGAVEVKDWLEKCRQILQDSAVNKLVLTVALPAQLDDLLSMGEDLMVQARKNGCEALNPLIKGMCDALQKLKLKIAPLVQNGNATRPKPVVLVLLGQSGVGKSNLCVQLARELAYVEASVDPTRLEAYKAQMRNEIYFKGVDKYEDTMTSRQSVYVHDDWMQENPVKGMENPPGPTFIHMNNDMCFTPRMADVADKNNVFAQFTYSLYTTNLNRIQDETALQPKAIGRRMDFVLDVRLKEGAELGVKFDPGVYELHEMKFRPDQLDFVATGNVWTCQHLLYRMVTKAADNKSYWQQSLTDPGQIFGDWRAREREDRVEALIESLMEELPFFDAQAQSGFTFWKDYDDKCREQAIDDAIAWTISHSTVRRHILGTSDSYTGQPESTRRYLGFHLGSVDEWAYQIEKRTETHKDVWHWRFGRKYPDSTYDRLVKLRPQLLKLKRGAFFKFLCRAHEVDITEPVSMDISDYASLGVEKVSDLFAPLSKRVSEAVAIATTPISRAARAIVDFVESSPIAFTAAASLVSSAITFLGLGATSYVVSKFLGGKKKKKSSVKEAQDSRPTSNSTVKDRKNHKNRKTRQAYRDIKLAKMGMGSESQGGSRKAQRAKERAETQSTATLEVASLVRKNLLEIWATDADGVSKVGYAMALFGRVFHMPAHIFAHIFEFSTVYKEIDPKLVSFELRQYKLPTMKVSLADMEIIYCDDSGDTDVLIFGLPKTVSREFRDITGHFFSSDDAYSLLFTATRSFSGSLVSHDQMWNFETGFAAAKIYCKDVDEYRTNCLGYNVPTKKGDCGLPVLVDNSRYAGKIIGFHIAGSGGRYGFSNIVSRKLLAQVCEGMRKDQTKYGSFDLPDITLDVEGIMVQGARDYHNGVAAKYILRNLQPPGGTFIQNNIVRFEGEGPDYIEPKTMPSDVSPHRFAPNRALYGPVKITGDLSKLRELVPYATTFYMSRARHVIMRNYTFGEAIRGIPGSHLGPMDPTTSPGFPDTSFDIQRRDYWKVHPDGAFEPGPEFGHLLDEVEAYANLLVNGGVPLITFKDVEKGERLKIHKVENGLVRFVNAPPLSLHVLVVMYFGAAFEVLMTGAPLNSILKGMDEKNAVSWDLVARQLKSVGGGQWVGSGDYAGFDHRQHHEIQAMALEVLAGMYPEGDTNGNRIRAGIIEILRSGTYHVFGSVVEQYEDGMPSGFRATTEINCVTNLLFFMGLWVELHDGDPLSALDFEDHVSALFLGDDNIFSVSERYKDIFTEEAVAGFVSKYGHVYTSADKSPAKKVLTPLENHTVLKRSFRFEPLAQEYVGPLDLDVVLEIPLWTRSGQDYLKIAVDNMNTAIRELSLHGREVFDLWLPKMRVFAGRHWAPVSEDWWTVFRLTAGLPYRSTGLFYESVKELVPIN